MVGDLLGQGADRRVFDVPKQVLDADLFRFFGADLRRDVLEGFGGGGAVVVNFLDGAVSLGGKPDVLQLDVDDHEDRLGTVVSDQVVDEDVVLVELGSRVVPPDDLLLRVDLK